MRSITAAIFASTPEVQTAVEALLTARGCRVLNDCGIPDVASGLVHADLAIIECSSRPGHPGLDLARRLRERKNDIRIVIVTARSSESLAIEALRIGVREYLKAPFDGRRLADVLAQCRSDVEPEEGSSLDSAIIGEAEAMRRVKESIRSYAPTTSSVLITGETGTGKEMVAEHIHRASTRSKRPFICINCAAIPETLLESELFGYSKGAFTGAVTARDGKLAQADGGTVFFDEIGDMSLLAQAKILRAIESKEIYPLGSGRKVHIDVRVVAATNRDLESMVQEQRFRADLYFRLNVARITLPPLRERRSDIPLLAKDLLRHFNRVFGREVECFDEEALEELMSYSWPGNVRELRNVLEVIYLNGATRTISVEHLPQAVRRTKHGGCAPQDERERLMSALLATHWNVSETARQLHWSRMTLYRKLAKYNIVTSRPPVTAKSKSAASCDIA